MNDNALALTGLDQLSPEEQEQLMEIYQEELEVSRDGIDLQPIRFKINKDTCTFTDPFGNALKNLNGVIVYKQKVRGYWDRSADNNVPECSSQDGRIGVVSATGQKRKCAECPYNQWGSATDEAGNRMDGKACKEMRRLFIKLDDYHLPILVSLPPTSIRNFDNYISARITRGIPDIAAKTVISLIPEKGGKFSYAVANFEMGEKLAVKDLLELNKLRTKLQETAETITIDNDDYATSEVVDAQAEVAAEDEQPF